MPSITIRTRNKPISGRCGGSWTGAGQGVELVGITPGMVGQYLVALDGSPAKRNQHLAALRGFFDRLVQRHVVILNPASSVKGVKEQVIEGKTPEITLEQARTLLGSINVAKTAKNDQGEEIKIPLVVGLRDRAILATFAYTACRAGAVAKLRLGDFQHDGTQYVLRFSEKGGKTREIPVRHDLEGHIRWGNSSKPWVLLTIRSQATWQRTSRRSINTSSGRHATTLLFLQHIAAGRIP